MEWRRFSAGNVIGVIIPCSAQEVIMSSFSNHFHDGNRELQDRFDTRQLADYCAGKLVKDFINPKQKAFIESADMFFLATVDQEGRPCCSYKGGDPGFVRVLDEHTIAVPNYDGDGKYL